MSAFNQLNAGNESNNNMFRATKVWNDVLHSFFNGIQLKKHRKHMRTHHNCFVATEAVDWLFNYLQMSPHFREQQILRSQAIKLLRKYLKTDVIERVDSKKANQEFEDNKDLYRFTKHIENELIHKKLSKSDENLSRINPLKDMTSPSTRSLCRPFRSRGLSESHLPNRAFPQRSNCPQPFPRLNMPSQANVPQRHLSQRNASERHLLRRHLPLERQVSHTNERQIFERPLATPSFSNPSSSNPYATVRLPQRYVPERNMRERYMLERLVRERYLLEKHLPERYLPQRQPQPVSCLQEPICTNAFTGTHLPEYVAPKSSCSRMYQDYFCVDL